MAQQIVVSELKKQIISKQTALETALKQNKMLEEKRIKLQEKASADFDKAVVAWTQAVRAQIKSMKLTDENSNIEGRGYRHNFNGASVTITLKDAPKYPERADINWRDYVIAVPTYYDFRHNPISSDAVLAHFRKCLEMLEVLPAGTVEVTISKFDFLTKF